MATLFAAEYTNKELHAFDTLDLSLIDTLPIDQTGGPPSVWLRGLTWYNGIVYGVSSSNRLQTYDSNLFSFLSSYSYAPKIGTMYDVAADGTTVWIITDTDPNLPFVNGIGLGAVAISDLTTITSSIGRGYLVHAHGDYIYRTKYASSTVIRKYLKTDQVTELASYTVSGAVNITAIGDYIFVIGSATLYKLNVADLSLDLSIPVSDFTSKVIRGMTSDDTHLYISASPSEGIPSIYKLLASDLSLVTSIDGSYGALWRALTNDFNPAPPAPAGPSTFGNIVW